MKARIYYRDGGYGTRQQLAEAQEEAEDSLGYGNNAVIVVVDSAAGKIVVLADEGVRTKSGQELGQKFLNGLTGNLKFSRVFSSGLLEQWGFDPTGLVEYQGLICCASCKKIIISAFEEGI